MLLRRFLFFHLFLMWLPFVIATYGGPFSGCGNDTSASDEEEDEEGESLADNPNAKSSVAVSTFFASMKEALSLESHLLTSYQTASSNCSSSGTVAASQSTSGESVFANFTFSDCASTFLGVTMNGVISSTTVGDSTTILFDLEVSFSETPFSFSGSQTTVGETLTFDLEASFKGGETYRVSGEATKTLGPSPIFTGTFEVSLDGATVVECSYDNINMTNLTCESVAEGCDTASAYCDS